MKQKRGSGVFSGMLKNEQGTRQFYQTKDGKQGVRSPMSPTGKREDGQITPFLRQGVTNRMYEILNWGRKSSPHWLRWYWEEEYSWEGSKKRVKRICDQWRSWNMQDDIVPPAVTSEQYKAGAMVACPMWISWGRLDSIRVKEGVSDIAIGELEITKETTLGDLSRAIVSRNAGWRYGDRLTWVWLRQVKENGLPKVKPRYWELTLMEDAEDELVSQIGHWGLMSKDGYLYAGGVEKVGGGFCWIHSGWREKEWRVSAQKLVMGEDRRVLEEYTSEAMWQKAAEAFRQAQGKLGREAKGEMAKGDGREAIGQAQGKLEMTEADMEKLKDVIKEAVREGVADAMKEALREVLGEYLERKSQP